MFTSLNLALGFPKGVNHPVVWGGITGGTYCFHRSYTACTSSRAVVCECCSQTRGNGNRMSLGHFPYPAAGETPELSKNVVTRLSQTLTASVNYA